MDFPADQLVYDLDFDAYKKQAGINASLLKAMAVSPAHGNLYMQGGLKTSKEMEFGTLAHMAILEPERFAQEVLLQPDFAEITGGQHHASRAYKDAKAGWMQAQGPNAMSLSFKDMAHIKAMASSLRAQKEIVELLAGGRSEVSFRWHDAHQDMTCKGRADLISPGGLLVDIKTAKSALPHAISRMIGDMGYHIQAAHYLEFGRQSGLYDHENFLLVAMEKTPPYACAGYFLDEATLLAGAQARAAAMRSLQECLKTGSWPGYPGLSVVGLPPWLLPRKEPSDAR